MGISGMVSLSINGGFSVASVEGAPVLRFLGFVLFHLVWFPLSAEAENGSLFPGGGVDFQDAQLQRIRWEAARRQVLRCPCAAVPSAAGTQPSHPVTHSLVPRAHNRT
jgi:hypothetical protein